MAFRKKLLLHYANCLNQLCKYEGEQNVKCCWKFIDVHVFLFIILTVRGRPVRMQTLFSGIYAYVVVCIIVTVSQFDNNVQEVVKK